MRFFVAAAPVGNTSASRTLRRSVVVCSVGLVLTGWPSVAAAQVSSAAAALERHGVRVEAGEIAAVEQGEAFAKILPTALNRDVAVIGIVRVDQSRERVSTRLRDLRTWLRSPTRERLGVFGSPPTLSDLGALQVSETDVRELQKCRPGSCTTKLSAAEMERAQRELDWSAPDLLPRVTQLARQRLLRLADDYRTRGDAALPTYADREPGVRAADVADALLLQSSFLQQVAPSIATHLRAYPGNRLAGASDALYWSENVVPRLRPILSLTHAVTYMPPEPGGFTLVAAKQVYANHYFEGALDLVDVVERAVPGDGASVYVVIERRFRFDNLPRGLLNIRGRATSGLRDQLLTDLRRYRMTE